MIKDLREKGMSISEISRRLGIDRKTVRKYVKSDRVPRPSTRRRKSKFDPVKPIIKMLIDKYNLSAVRILEEIRKIARDNEDVKLLMTIPGIDYYLASFLSSYIADVHRFPMRVNWHHSSA